MNSEKDYKEGRTEGAQERTKRSLEPSIQGVRSQEGDRTGRERMHHRVRDPAGRKTEVQPRMGGGGMWAECGFGSRAEAEREGSNSSGSAPLKGVENRLGPPSPTFAHFDFSQANLETKVREMECRSIGVLRGRHERRRVRCAPGGQADFCGKKRGLLRESSRRSGP